MERRFWMVALLLALSGSVDCRTGPILPFGGTVHGQPESDVATRIKRAGSQLGWVMVDQGPGELKGTLALRRHVVVVDIRYDTDSYEILYVSSENMMQKGSTIHRQYNNWVKNLKQAIDEELLL